MNFVGREAISLIKIVFEGEFLKKLYCKGRAMMLGKNCVHRAFGLKGMSWRQKSTPLAPFTLFLLASDSAIGDIVAIKHTIPADLLS